jgi:pimeloyl-ACP methyl ester carboxylesterase
MFSVNPPLRSHLLHRAACDARSADVFASVFYLPKPRPLNYLINNLWRGPTAVVQGVLDPLNDARGRADQLERECPGTRVWAINAGHCPHDEAPAEVNRALLEFVEQMVMPAQQQQQQGVAAGKVPVTSRS